MSGLVSEKLQKLSAYNPDLGLSLIHLDANESFLELSEGLKNEIARRVAALSYNRYPDPLASAACKAFGRRYGVGDEFITAGNGSDELISVILNSFTQRGDRVLITQPDFSMYRIYCSMAEVQPVILGKRGDLGFEADEMIELANSSDVRLVLFSNPCNPTGQGIAAEDALKIADSIRGLVVIDEAYMDFWDQSIINQAPSRANLIVLRTCSKVGFAAARLGFAVANPELTGYLRAAKSPYNVNALTQAAGEALLSDKNYLTGAVEEIRSSRDSLYSSLKALELLYPKILQVFVSHANFVTVKVADAAVLHAKLKARGISVRLVAESYFRITAGTKAENESLLGEMKTILEEVKD